MSELSWARIEWAVDPRVRDSEVSFRGWSPRGDRFAVAFGVYPDERYAIVDVASWRIGPDHADITAVALGETRTAWVSTNAGTVTFDDGLGFTFPPSSGGAHALVSDDDHLAVTRMAGTAGLALIWSLATGGEPIVLADVPVGVGATVAFVAGTHELRATGREHPIWGNQLLYFDGTRATVVTATLDIRNPRRVAQSADGRVLAVSGVVDATPTLCIFGLPSLEPMGELPLGEHYAHALALSRDGSRIAFTLGPSNGPGSVHVVDTTTGAQLARWRQGANDWLESTLVQITPDGARVLWMPSGCLGAWRIADIDIAN